MQFRPRWLLAATLALTFLHPGCEAAAQVFEVAAGASTAYGAEGASVVIHGQNTLTTFGAGLVGGHFAAGGSAIRPISGGSLTVGQQLFRMDVPTDVFDTTHVFFGTGAGIKMKREQGSSLEAFAGVSSQEGGTPLFTTTALKDPSAYAQWIHPLTYGCTIVSTALLSRQSSALQSFECGKHSSIRYAATIGIGGGSPYAAASVVIKKSRLHVHAAYIYAGKNFQRGNDFIEPTPEPIKENVTAEYKLTRNIDLTAMHQHFLVMPSLQDVQLQAAITPTRSNLDTVGVQYHRLSWGAGLTFIHSSSLVVDTSIAGESSGTNSAYSAVLHKNFGRWDLTESLLHSFGYGNSTSTILINALGVNVNAHLRLTENVNVTSGGVTFSHGGALLTAYSSFEVDYQTYYVATDPSHPFQQAMTFDARVRLPRNLALHAGSNIGPTGLTQYTFELASSFAHDAILPETLNKGGLGINVLRGRVVDPSGQPVEGAAVMVGTERLYSDADGIFFFREKNPHKYPFKVLPEEFITPWNYTTRSAPVEVQTSPGTVMLTVVVARTDQPVVFSGIVKVKKAEEFGAFHPYKPLGKTAPIPANPVVAPVAETEFGAYRPYQQASQATVASLSSPKSADKH